MHGRGSGHDRSQGALDGERYRFWDLKSSAGGGFWERRATLLFVCMGRAFLPKVVDQVKGSSPEVVA